MEIIAFLRGVTPTGKNKIPKMLYLVQILEEIGFKNVKTYIQTGNIILETEFSKEKTAQAIHDIILDKIGADLKVIIKTKQELVKAVKENPFDEKYDYSRIHLVFTNDEIDKNKINMLKKIEFKEEEFVETSKCFYIYLPKDAKKKKLNTNYIENKLSIKATTRKINVVENLINMCK